MSFDYSPFLASKNPVVAYNAALLTAGSDAGPFRRKMLADARLRLILARLADWPGPSIASHKSAQQFFHQLAFLADAGFKAGDEGIPAIIERILAQRDENGIPQALMTISEAYGGNGMETPGWALCDAPTTLYALLKLGCTDPSLAVAIAFLAEKVRDNGWGCTVSSALGSWRGPGKKGDPCPYATLIMTKLLLQADPLRYATPIATGAECLLSLWENSLSKHPYIFYMGNDFRKLKLPFIWYDILHLAEVISRIPALTADSRFREMISIIASKEQPSGGFIPESVYAPWKEWDFGQKKRVSDMLTFQVSRILNRLESAAPSY